MCEFLLCTRINDCNGDVHVIRSPFTEENVRQVETLDVEDPLSLWPWTTGVIWLEPWDDQEDIIHPSDGFHPERWEEE